MINDITDRDIAELSDVDLRELVGKLCEATLNKNNIDSICVTYGGSQTEPDGGVDVRVSSTAEFNENWAVPRNNTIFQVKKPSMTNSEIIHEMKNKNGTIKESIKKLVELKGAYIIVSSGDSLADKRKNERVSCMEEILSEIDKDQNVKVDFYDSKRIAIWVKQFPALVIWVNDKVYKRTLGWENYYNWSNPGETEKEFIIDNEVFLHKENFSRDNQINIIDGINEIRNLLDTEGRVIRLAGLSGVGKTRFAQALFDPKIGKNFLNKENVIYCDIGNEPTPVPVTFIQELISLQEKVILIIDNCDKELHNKLAQLISAANSRLSLLTIEYDVKEDINIESYNYYLDTSSDDTIRKLLKRDFNYIADANIETIVKCSDGNFRIARYLAKTINKNESIGILKSEEMFKRLFFQNNQESEILLDIGRVCSIFISFNTEFNKDDNNSELDILGKIIDKKLIELIRNINELNKRQIVQKRGNMRAVLPHAISNRLADELLSSLPEEMVVDEIKKSKRLELSFFRRLKFLHDKEYSIKIAEQYLSKINFQNLNMHEMEILNCIKVIIPEKILCKFEKIKEDEFFSRENNNYYYEFSNILSYIAYDQNYFHRAIILLIKFAMSEKENENYKSIRDILYRLFHLMLSGTHATIEERLKIIDLLLISEDKRFKRLAINLLNELLETDGCRYIVEDENTSRKRDYGYFPKTDDEYKQWYISIFSYCEKIMKNTELKEDIKDILSKNFRDLASRGFFYELEKIVENVLKNETWPQIWTSVALIKRFDLDEISEDMLERMNKLQEKCIPKTIDDKILIFLNKKSRIFVGLDDIVEDEEKICEIIRNLGKDIAQNKNEIEKNLLKLDDTCDTYRIFEFTKGLFEEVSDASELVYFLLENINEYNKNIFLEIISDLISLMNEEDKAVDILDQILQSEKYRIYYPQVQFGYKLKEKDIERVKTALLTNAASIEDYSRIQYVLSNISTEKIIEILNLFPKNQISENIIIGALHNLYWNKRKDEKLDEYARNFVTGLNYKNRNERADRFNYQLGKIIKNCFSNGETSKDAIIIFDKFKQLIKENHISYYGYTNVLKPLVTLYPEEFLNMLFLNEDIDESRRKYFAKEYGYHESIIDVIDEEILIQWLGKNGKAYEMSSVINPIKKIKDVFKWKKIGIYLIENYTDDERIIKNLFRGIYPTSWCDKYSGVLKDRLSLANELKDNTNENVKKVGILLEYNLNKQIEEAQIEEMKEQNLYNAFE